MGSLLSTLAVLCTGAKSFLVNYRIGGGRKAPNKRVVLGRFGRMSVDEARRLAIGEIAPADLLGAGAECSGDGGGRAHDAHLGSERGPSGCTSLSCSVSLARMPPDSPGKTTTACSTVPSARHPQSEARRCAVPQHGLASVRRREGPRPRLGDLRLVRHVPIPSVRFCRDRRVAGVPSLGNTQDTPGNGAGFGDRKGRKCRAQTPRGLQAVVATGLSALRGCAGGLRFSTPFGAVSSHPTHRRTHILGAQEGCDGLPDPLGRLLDFPVPEMGVSQRRADIGMAKQAGDHRHRHAVHHCVAGMGMPEIVKANTLDASLAPDTIPERKVAAAGLGGIARRRKYEGASAARSAFENTAGPGY